MATNNRGLSFDPMRNLNLNNSNRKSVPTTASEYWDTIPSPLDIKLDPLVGAAATNFVNWVNTTPIEEQQKMFDPMKFVNQWNKGLNGLSDDERNLWEKQNAPWIDGKDYEYKDRMWRNQMFLDLTHRDMGLFNSLPANERDYIVDNAITNQAVRSKYAGNRNMNDLLDLTPEGKKELLESDYISDAFLKREHDALAKKNGEEKKWGDYSLKERTSALWHNIKKGAMDYASMGFATGLIADGIGAVPGMIVGALAGSTAGAIEGILHPEDVLEVENADNAEILNKIEAKDNKRKEEIVKDRTEAYLEDYYKKLMTGELDEDAINEEFEDIALSGTKTETDALGQEHSYDYTGSNYYNVFKGTTGMKGFDTQQQVKNLAKYKAIKERFGEGSALNVLDQNIQEYIEGEQTELRRIWNTTQNIGVGGVANIMNRGLGLAALEVALTHGTDGLAEFLQGRDASGDGSENSLWKNPQYWEKVDQYNTFNPSAIEKFDKYGGVSVWNNVYKPGTENDWGWNTLYEALKMSKFMWSDALVNKGLQQALKFGTVATGGIYTDEGILATESSLKSKVLNKLGAAGIVSTSSVGIDVAYGMQTFNDVLAANNARLDNLIDKEVDDEIARFKKTPEYREGLEAAIIETNNKRKQDALQNNTLYKAVDPDEAVQAYDNQLRRQLTELKALEHVEDRKQAEADAAQAYAIDATIEAVRMAPTMAVYKNYLFDKGTLNAIGANNPYLRTQFRNGKYELVEGAVGKKGLNETISRVWGGFHSNYFDDVTVGFAKGYGIQDYNNYLYRKYNPVTYGDVLDDYVLPYVAGMAGMRDAMTEKRSLMDGAIGALGTAFSFGFGSGSFSGKTHKTVMKEAREAAGEGGEGLSFHWTEAVSHYINNPIISAFADAYASKRITERALNRANKTIKDNLHSLDNTVETLGALNETAMAREGTSLMEAEDAKDRSAFALANSLLSLKGNPVVVNAEQAPEEAAWQRKKDSTSKWAKILNAILSATHAVTDVVAPELVVETADSPYHRVMQTLEDAKAIDSDNVSQEQAERQQELLKTFIGLSNNKNALRSMTDEDKVAFAKERLKKNATNLLDIINKTEAIRKSLDNSFYPFHPAVKEQIAYQYVMDDRFKTRAKNLESNITGEEIEQDAESWWKQHQAQIVQSTNSTQNTVARYGNVENAEKAIESQKKSIERISEQIKDKKQAIDTIKKAPKLNIRIREEILAQPRLELATLEENLNTAKQELTQMQKDLSILKDVSESGEVPLITAEMILQLNPNERYRILDDYHKNDYSIMQQFEIERAKSLLISDGKTINQALEEVRDAAILHNRISDNMAVAKRIMRDPKTANDMVNALKENRKRQVINYFNDKIVFEAFQDFKGRLQNDVGEGNIEGATEVAKGLSTSVLNGLNNAIEVALEHTSLMSEDSDKLLTTMQTGVKAALAERRARFKDIADMDDYVRQTDQIDHTEFVKGPDVIDESTGIILFPGALFQQTEKREISHNDRLLLQDALDYATENSIDINKLADEVTSTRFQQYVQERNHSKRRGRTQSIEDIANPVSPEYMRTLVEDMVSSFNTHKEEVKKAKEAKKTAAQPTSVVTKPVEPSADRAPSPDKPAPEEAPAADTEGGSSNINNQILDAVFGSGITRSEMSAMLSLVDGLSDVDSATKDAIKQIMLNVASAVGSMKIREFLNKVKSLSVTENQDIRRAINRISIADILAKKNSAATSPTSSSSPVVEAEPVQSQNVSLVSQDWNVVLNDEKHAATASIWKDFVNKYKILSILKKLPGLMLRKNNFTPQIVFLHDPSLTSQVREAMKDEYTDGDAPIIMAIKLTKPLKRDIAKELNIKEEDIETINVKNVPSKYPHEYLPIGIMPSDTETDTGNAAVKETSSLMKKLRGQITSVEDTEILRKSGPKSGAIITNIASISNGESEGISSTATTPMKDVTTLMSENASNPAESIIGEVSEQDKQEYNTALEKGKKESRATKLYRRMREAFVKALRKDEIPVGEGDENSENTRARLLFHADKNTAGKRNLHIFIQRIGDTVDKNGIEKITDLLKNFQGKYDEALAIISSNSRIERLFKALRTNKDNILLPSNLYTAEGRKVSDFDTQVKAFEESVKRAILNNFNIVDGDVKAEIIDVEKNGDTKHYASITVTGTWGIAENVELANLQYEIGKSRDILTGEKSNLDSIDYVRFIKDLLLDDSGETRKTGKRSKSGIEYEVVKWQVNYEDATVANDNDSAHKKEAQGNLNDIFDDGILQIPTNKLSYPATSVTVGAGRGNTLKEFFSPTAKPEVVTSPTGVRPSNTVDVNSVLLDADTGLVLDKADTATAAKVVTLPARKYNAVMELVEKSKERKLDKTNDKRYNIRGKLHGRITSIKAAIRNTLEKFADNPNSPALALGNSFDEFCRNVANRIYNRLSVAERAEEFGLLDNSTPDNYEAAYQKVLNLQNKLLVNHTAAMLKLGDKSDPGAITVQGEVDVVVKGKDGTKTVKLALAGTLDGIAMDEHGDVYIIDYKTSRETLDLDSAERKGYDIQQSLYAKFLEKELEPYGVKVKGLLLLPASVSYETSGVTYSRQSDGNNQLMKDGKEFHDANFRVANDFITLPIMQNDELSINFSELEKEDKEIIKAMLMDQGIEIEDTDDIENVITEQEEEKTNADDVEDGLDIKPLDTGTIDVLAELGLLPSNMTETEVITEINPEESSKEKIDKKNEGCAR